jgi:hypothetical protein
LRANSSSSSLPKPGAAETAAAPTGALGVETLSIGRAADVNRLVVLEAAGHPERFEGWRQWTAPTLEVWGLPASPAAVDGESRTWDPPLRFTIRPNALRVRIALGERGASPASLNTPVTLRTIVVLARLLASRPSGIRDHGIQATHDHS